MACVSASCITLRTFCPQTISHTSLSQLVFFLCHHVAHKTGVTLGCVLILEYEKLGELQLPRYLGSSLGLNFAVVCVDCSSWFLNLRFANKWRASTGSGIKVDHTTFFYVSALLQTSRHGRDLLRLREVTCSFACLTC